jgi:Uma2 family endonuclease
MLYDLNHLCRLTVSQYRRLHELGIVSSTQQVELLEGFLIENMPRNPRNNPATRAFEKSVSEQLPNGWVLLISRAIPLCESKPESEPEPDYMIVRATADLDCKNSLRPDDIGVVVEIVGSYPPLERVDLGRIYARARIPVYWVFDFVAQIIEVFTQPSGPIDCPHYAKRDKYPVGSAVPVVLDGTTVGTIAVADVMG